MSKLINLVESYPVIAGAIITIIIGIIGFFIRRKWFYDKDSGKTDKLPEQNLGSFEKLLKNGTWRYENIDNREVYICESDNMFQVVIPHDRDVEEDFREKWIEIFPDKEGCFTFPVYLVINGVKIREVLLVSCDGRRVSMPMPNISTGLFDRSSIQYKVADMIYRSYGHEFVRFPPNHNSFDYIIEFVEKKSRPGSSIG